MAKKCELVAYTKFLKGLNPHLFFEMTPLELVERYEENNNNLVKSSASICDNILIKGGWCGSEECSHRRCPYVESNNYRICDYFKEQK